MIVIPDLTPFSPSASHTNIMETPATTLPLGTSLPVRQSTPQFRLDYLDGLRGIAALYVVIYHVYLVLALHGQWQKLPAIIQSGLNWVQYGHVSVVVFIVLSGYCLALPIARSSTKNLSGGLKGFALRRARRLLPPYYASLVISLLLVVIGYVLQSKHSNATADIASNFTPASILSHIFMVHNLSTATVFTINSPFWSVATEAQIYVFFALLLLPLWRRTGVIATTLVAFVIGLTPHLGFHGAFDQACPWFLGLFALGLAAADVSFSVKPNLTKMRTGLPCLYIALTGGLGVAVGYSVYPIPLVFWPIDVVLGCSTASLLIFCTAYLVTPTSRQKPVILRILEAKSALYLGLISYSIYLIHDPILHIAQFLMAKLRFSPPLELGVLLFGIVPLIIGLSYMFHVMFERPFMRNPKAIEQKEKAL